MTVSSALLYDDVSVGATPLDLSLTVTVPLMFRWSAAGEINRRDHYDSKWSVEFGGLPGAVLSGSFTLAYWWGLLFNWVGPNGWVYRLYHRHSVAVYEGETLTFFGKIVEKEVKDGLGYVSLELGFRRPDGSVPVPGQATVVLPLRGGRPVPYPFTV
jgi:acyl dehydratase